MHVCPACGDWCQCPEGEELEDTWPECTHECELEAEDEEPKDPDEPDDDEQLRETDE